MVLLFRRRVQAYIVATTLLLFILIALDIYFEGTLFRFDAVVHQWSLGWHTPLADKIVHGITQLGNLSTMLVYLLLLSFYFLWRGERKTLLVLWGSLGGGAALFSILKELFQRVRPSSYIGEFHQHGYSFPSGHATMSMIFALSLFYLFYPKSKGFYRILLLAFVLLFPVMIAFSRVYLGVHYFTDVTAGLVLGIFWVMFVVWCLGAYKARNSVASELQH